MSKLKSKASDALFQVFLAVGVPLALGAAIFMIVQRSMDSRSLVDLQSGVEVNKKDLQATKQTVTEQGKKLDTHQEAIKALEARVGAAEERIGENAAGIARHDREIGEARKAVDDAKKKAAEDLAEISGRVAAAAAELEKAIEAGRAANLKADSLEKDVSQLRGDLKKALEDLNRRMDLIEKMAQEKAGGTQ